ncbi:hypothetical protein [Salinisphaera orenii]|uniref:hypothetical protein n=1 Tax=Salinisphaera orenii TaxID=856731 RepID=UPI0011CE9BEA|nr:hypothetical protein [Salinisphaera halophila]
MAILINPAPKQLNCQLFSTRSEIEVGACLSFIFKPFAADGRGEHASACSLHQPGMKVFSCRVNSASFSRLCESLISDDIKQRGRGRNA